MIKDRLNGDDNSSPLKERFILVLQEFELWDIVVNAIVPSIDPILLVDFNERNFNSKRLLLDAIKYNIIPHV